MTDRLERRYRRLLRVYPADYRAERGDELVGTYLDTAAPDRTWPGPRDATDVLAGGLRQRLRTYGASGLPGGASIAAGIALTTGSVLAAVWMLLIELVPAPTYRGSDPFGPFRSSGAYVWLVWLAAALVFASGSGRWCRRLIALALVLTVVVKPVAWLAIDDWTWYARSAIENWGQYGFTPDPAVPSGIVLTPMAALGVIALAVPSRPGKVVRWVPLVAATAPIGAALRLGNFQFRSYARLAPTVFEGVAPALLGAAVVVMIVLLLRRDARALWVPIVLMTPLALLLVDPITGLMIPLLMGQPWDAQFWYERSTVSMLLTVLTVGVLALAVAITGHRRKSTAADNEARTP